MRTRTLTAVAALAIGAATLVAAPAPSVEAVPSGFTDTQVVPTAFAAPTAVKVLPGGDLLVLEKAGALRRVALDGTVTPAGTVPVGSCGGGERGLLERGARPVVRHHRHDLHLRHPAGLGRLRQHALQVHADRCRSDRRAGADRQHRLVGHQPQRRHRGGRARRLPVPERRRGCRHVQGPEPRIARRQDPADHHERRAGTREPVPRGNGARPMRTDRAGGGSVRGDLRPRSAQPVPHRLRPELGHHTVPDQRRRCRRLGGGRRRSRRRQLRMADA